LETSRFKKAISPHKIQGLNGEVLADVFLRDLIAINEFLYYLEAEPFITSEKAESVKRFSFKSTSKILVKIDK